MNALPLARFNLDPLHNNPLVLEQEFHGNVGIHQRLVLGVGGDGTVSFQRNLDQVDRRIARVAGLVTDTAWNAWHPSDRPGFIE